MKDYELELLYKDGSRRIVLLPHMDEAAVDRQITLRANSGMLVEIRLGVNGRPCRTVWEA